MAVKKGATKEKGWDDESNEATNSFVTWGEVGDKVMGTLVGRKQVPSTLPDRAGELQWVYEIKVGEASYHKLDDKNRVIEPAEEPEEGEIISVGGRSTIDSRMARVKLGQIVGLKFVEELAPKTKGYNPTKIVKVYTPRDDNNDFKMDAEYLREHEDDNMPE